MRIVTTLPHKEFPVAEGNFDKSRAPQINLIVLHTQVGFHTGTEATFNNPQSHVSAHYGVNTDGTLDHFLEENYTAYHAGDYATNQRSLGIEHEDLGKPFDTRPDALYEASARLVADLCNFYAIPVDRAHIIRHNEVVKANGLKVPTGCPDLLDVDRIVNRAKELLVPPQTQAQEPPAAVQSATTGTNIDQGAYNYLVEQFKGKSKSGQNWGNMEGMLREVFGDWLNWTSPGADGKPKVIMPSSAFEALSAKAAKYDLLAVTVAAKPDIPANLLSKLGDLYNAIFIK